MLSTNPISQSSRRSAHRGFSLIELVVVILILGVIAAIAAPRMFNTADQATVNGTRQTLSVIRNAIEIYRVNNADYPPDTDSDTFKAALRPYLNAPIPAPATLADTKDANVLMDSGTTSTPFDAAADDDEDHGWVYKKATGSFRINVTSGPESSW